MSKIKEFLTDPNGNIKEYDTPLLALVRNRVADEINWSKINMDTPEYDSGDFYDKQMDKLFWGKSPMTPEVTKADAVNPKHYKDIIPGYQYIQLMEYMLAGKTGVEAHLLGQIYKYATRLGKKDSLEQDASKIAWYACCLRDYYKNGNHVPKELDY